MTTVLVMGGSRFIGKHLLSLLDNYDYDITVINRGSIPEEQYLPNGATQLSADRNDRKKMSEILLNRSFDIIFDISAISADHVDILLDAVAKPPKRHIHVSSGSVYDIYGEDPPIFSQPISEDFPIGPISENEHPYMNAKRGAEQVLLDKYATENYPVSIIRPTFVYGPDNYIYREAYFFDRISNNYPILLPNKGHGFIDMVYVDDLVNMIFKISQAPEDKVNGEAFNGTRGRLISANMYVKTIAKIMDKDPKILYYDPSELMEMKWPEQELLYPYIPDGGIFHDDTKIKEQLGITSQRSYLEGLAEAYRWWKDNDTTKPRSELEQLLVAYLQAEEEKEELKSQLITKILQRNLEIHNDNEK